MFPPLTSARDVGHFHQLPWGYMDHHRHIGLLWLLICCHICQLFLVCSRDSDCLGQKVQRFHCVSHLQLLFMIEKITVFLSDILASTAVYCY